MSFVPPTMWDPVELCKNNKRGIAGTLCHRSDTKRASQFDNISELKLAGGGGGGGGRRGGGGGETNSVVHTDVSRRGKPGGEECSDPRSHTVMGREPSSVASLSHWTCLIFPVDLSDWTPSDTTMHICDAQQCGKYADMCIDCEIVPR